MMKLTSLFLVILSVELISTANGLKIFGILPFGSKSHWAIGHSIIKSLVDAGHEATVASPYPLKSPIKNYREIDIASILVAFDHDNKMNAFQVRKMPSIMTILFLHNVGIQVVNEVMNHENIQKLMQSNEKFDICFLELFHASALTGLFDHFGCIYVPYTSAGVLQWADVITSNQSPSSYVVTPFLPYAGKLNFVERYWNAFYRLFENICYYTYSLPSQRGLYSKYFPNAKQTLDEMNAGPGLVFLGNHVTITGSRPYLPSMIEIGGIHIGQQKQLPKDIQEFMDSANDGVVLFSMGSIVRAIDWPVETREAFVKAFGKLKQKVIWKYENETLPNKPDNVMISSWIPQRDILAHKNIKLFISHGGYLGTTEATSEAVPILGIPFFGDQSMNIANAINTNRAVVLEVEDITEESLSKALNEILTNPKYQENADLISKRFHDRVMTPQQSVVYWTEYVARNKGASFLRAVGRDYSTIEFYSLDVYALIIAEVFALLAIIYLLFKYMLRKCCGKSSNTKVKTN